MIAKIIYLNEAKEKYRGVFEIQKSGDKTSSGEIINACVFCLIKNTLT